MEKKAILFLSALDFKEKSIQVIKKTPEAYLNNGWDVYYVVARDKSKYGNYYYENEINIPKLNLVRFNIPFYKVHSKIKYKIFRVFFNKIRYWLAILRLAYEGNKILKRKDISVIYGYEFHGVLAVNILKLFRKLKNIKIISRFQGVFYLNKYFKKKNYIKLLYSIDYLLALYLPADLCIMTNDGTKGTEILSKIKSNNLKNLKFWINGVDKLPDNIQLKKKRDKYVYYFLTVCRLVKSKRVDRVIEIINILVNKYNIKNIKYYIVGEGIEKENLISLISDYELEKYIVFKGAANHDKVMEYFTLADVFFSTYESSNVGNPLLEAIRTNKIIFTINNGDTGRWIKHKNNGFIYDENKPNLAYEMANDILLLMMDNNLQKMIKMNIKKTEQEKLWTWKKRFEAEINEVKKL